jgi:hypothetical protein|tara:strand:+ start:5593 stop:5766 length:174 start_codon:yes stop_codon:yes gene_type:complete
MTRENYDSDPENKKPNLVYDGSFISGWKISAETMREMKEIEDSQKAALARSRHIFID